MGPRGSSIYENNSKTELGDMKCEVEELDSDGLRKDRTVGRKVSSEITASFVEGITSWSKSSVFEESLFAPQLCSLAA